MNVTSKIIPLASVLALSVVFSPVSARADDYKVYSPRIEKGEIAAELNSNYSTDKDPANDHYFSQVLAVEAASTSWWKAELGGEVEKSQGTGHELTNLKFENIFSPWQPGQNFVDAGLYLEVEKAAHSDQPNNAEAKLLLEKQMGQVVTTANLIMSHEFGPNASHDWNTGMALGARYRMNQLFEPGVEYYADYGPIDNLSSFKNSDQRMGPTIQGKIGRVRYDTGVLFGLSGAAQDTTAKLNLEYEF